MNRLASTAGGEAFHAGLIVTAFGFGFRHGIDWDHLAALTDITSSQDHPRRSMLFATLYALGHALVVLALGIGAIVLATRLPAGIDATMERVVGATLVLLGCYVFYALVRQGRSFRMRSRWMLLFACVRSGRRWVTAHFRRRTPVVVVHEHAHSENGHHEHVHEFEHEHTHLFVTVGTSSVGGSSDAATPPGARREHRHVHRHVGSLPDDPFGDYAPRTAFGIGMIHGIGAETPTQLLIFLTAAGAGGKGVGLLLLGCFITGLLTSNTVIALAGTFGFLGAARNFRLYVAVSVTIAAFSIVIGTLFLLGSATALPALFGG